MTPPAKIVTRGDCLFFELLYPGGYQTIAGGLPGSRLGNESVAAVTEEGLAEITDAPAEVCAVWREFLRRWTGEEEEREIYHPQWRGRRRAA